MYIEIYFENHCDDTATRRLLRDEIYTSTVALWCIGHGAAFCGACIESEKAFRYSELQSLMYALIFWVICAKEIGTYTENVSLYNFWRWTPTLFEPSRQREVIVVATDTNSLLRYLIVSFTTPESDEDATEEIENPINSCRTPTRTWCREC